MAPPPKYLITRNLIRRYFQKILPDTKSLKYDDTELRGTLKAHGIGSPQSRDAYMNMVNRYNKMKKNAEEFEKVNARTEILNSLNFPRYKNLTKGKHKSFAVRPINIYDGIIK